MTPKTAGTEAPERRPAHWDKRVSAAYLRILGATQVEAAKAVGRSERTLQAWEADEETWRAARAEAESRWLVDLKHASMQSVLANVRAGNAVLGFQVLERLKAELAPPKHRHEHTGEDGGPIEHRQAVTIYVPDNGRDG